MPADNMISLEQRHATPSVLIARTLHSDAMTSIARYDAQVCRALAKGRGGLTGRVVSPLGQYIAWPRVRAVVRYAIYPAQVLALSRYRRNVLLHVTHESYAHLLLMTQGPAIITCHDLALFFHSELSHAQLNRWKAKLKWIHRARLVIAVSASTQRDLERILGVPPEKIVVNYSGVDEHFRRLGRDHVFSGIGRRLQALATQQPLALHVGTNLGRKNIPTLLKAVAAVRRDGVPLALVKVGPSLLRSPFGALVRELRLSEAIVEFGFLSEGELVEAYNLCGVFVFPSLYEGFGFPVLEAQACGLPCVISNATSLPEVGGTAALYHEPNDVAAMADGMRRALGNAIERTQLVAKGYQNIQRFSWDSHAQRLRDIYARVAGVAGGA